jgi:SulP family sulfate permease
MDSSAIHALDDIVTDLKENNLMVLFTGVKGPVRDAMVKGHLIEKIGDKNFFMSVQDAVDCYDQHCTKDASPAHQEFTLQTNA